MPNYSPARKVFSSTKKDIRELPFQEVFEAYMETYAEITEVRQAELDAEYEEELRQKEQEYNDAHEAPYEGNFSDSIAKPQLDIDSSMVQKRTTDAIKVKFLAKYGIHLHTDWIMPQLVTLLGNMPVERNSNGLVSGKKFIANFSTPWLRGIYYLNKINTKSTYLHLQYKAPSKEYGALVPLILYAQRLVKGIPYSAWDRDEIHYVVHSDLCDAMLLEPHNFTKEQILDIRNDGLTVKSGASEGERKNALTNHKLSGIKDMEWNSLPALAQVMLAQIWMAHPEAKTKYMILDPYNWDRMPPALVTSEVFNTDPKLKKANTALLDVPWTLWTYL